MTPSSGSQYRRWTTSTITACALILLAGLVLLAGLFISYGMGWLG